MSIGYKAASTTTPAAPPAMIPSQKTPKKLNGVTSPPVTVTVAKESFGSFRKLLILQVVTSDGCAGDVLACISAAARF